MLDEREHATATRLIAAGVITEHRDLLEPSQALALALEDRLLRDLRW